VSSILTQGTLNSWSPIVDQNTPLQYPYNICTIPYFKKWKAPVKVLIAERLTQRNLHFKHVPQQPQTDFKKIQNLIINLHDVHFLHFVWELIPSFMRKIHRLTLLKNKS